MTRAENFLPLWPTEWGGEVTEPEKNLPRSLLLSMMVIIAIYVWLNLAYIGVLSVAGMAGRPLVAADFASAVRGPLGAGLIAFLVMFSAVGANNGFVLTGPRVYYAMAR